MLYGVANSQSLVDGAIAGAREIVPVLPVQAEIQVVQSYGAMP
jgi:hypothetical protein